jgi:hypothetical protein
MFFFQFFEETAYRPETNQRPTYASSGHSQQHLIDYSKTGYYESPSSLQAYDRNHISNNSSSDSFFLNHNHRNYYSMSAPHSNAANSNPQLYSHLPRPTPYKSSSVWSTLGGPHQQPQRTTATGTPAAAVSASLAARQQLARNQPQTYYPFNQQDIYSSCHQSYGASPLRKIREEPNSGAKSAESILASGDGGFYETSQRSGSMECLAGISSSGLPASGKDWSEMGPGYRYSVAVDGNTNTNGSSHRRESTGSMPHANNAMVVTMSSTNSKIQGPYRHHSGDSSSIAVIPDSSIDLYDTTGHGYETKIVDRIKRSCEQKEEFLKRPNQPLVWAPQPSSSSTAFPKELYAQPQKFEKIPWPPAHIVPTVTSARPPLTQSSITNSASSSFDGQSGAMNNVSVVNVQHYPENGYSPTTLRTPHESQEYDTSRHRSTHVYNNSTPPYDARSISPSWLEYAPKNRTTIVGSGKLHCDPPPHWHPDLGSLTYDGAVEEDFEESGNYSTKHETDIEPRGNNNCHTTIITILEDSKSVEINFHFPVTS